jgi:hypothetical protein
MSKCVHCRTSFHAFTLALLSLASAVAVATEITVQAVMPVAYEREPVWMSGQAASIELKIAGTAVCDHIRAVLVQQAHALAAPHAERTLVACDGPNGALTSQSLQFTFTPPAVKRISRFSWEFARCSDSKDCQSIGDLGFTLVPAELLARIIAWANENVVYVEDPSGRLETFLDARGIDYVTSRSGIADDDRVMTLLVSGAAEIDLAASPLPGHFKRRVMLFQPAESAFPLVEISDDTKSRVIDIRLPILEHGLEDAAFDLLFYQWFFKLQP